MAFGVFFPYEEHQIAIYQQGRVPRLATETNSLDGNSVFGPPHGMDGIVEAWRCSRHGEFWNAKFCRNLRRRPGRFTKLLGKKDRGTSEFPPIGISLVDGEGAFFASTRSAMPTDQIGRCIWNLPGDI